MRLVYGRTLKAVGACAVVTTACALMPASSSALLTLGSNLGRAPDTSFEGVDGALTIQQNFLGAQFNAGEPYPPDMSPTNGTVMTWSIRVGDTDTGPVSLRVLRLGGALGSLTFGGSATSRTVTPPLNRVSTYITHLPIHVGDAIGIDCCAPGQPGQYFFDATASSVAARMAIWSPPLADGSPAREPDDSGTGFELAVNALVVPDAAFVRPHVRETRKGSLSVSVTLPNAGEVVAGDPIDPTIGSPTAIHNARPKLLKPVREMIWPGPQETAYPARLTVRPTKVARRLLAERGKLAAKLRIDFHPQFGGSYGQTIGVRLTD